MAHRLTHALVLVIALMAATAHAQTLPPPPALTGAVNDFAGVLDAASVQQLETLSRQLQAASGDVLVVATVRTFQPYADIESYAVRMFENQGKGIGERSGDSGVLLLLAVEDRQVRIEVGYGLEPFVTDGFAGETSRDVMVPYFRRNDYGMGLLAGATRVARRIAEGHGVDLAVAPLPRAPQRPQGELRINFVMLLILLYIIYRLTRGGPGSGGRRRRGRWSSSVGPFGVGTAWGGTTWGGGGWGGGSGGWGGSSGGFGGGFGGFGGGRSGGGGGGASW